jgi:hypothetical protein
VSHPSLSPALPALESSDLPEQIVEYRRPPVVTLRVTSFLFCLQSALFYAFAHRIATIFLESGKSFAQGGGGCRDGSGGTAAPLKIRQFQQTNQTQGLPQNDHGG